jgi:hypothetical protein
MAELGVGLQPNVACEFKRAGFLEGGVRAMQPSQASASARVCVIARFVCCIALPISSEASRLIRSAGRLRSNQCKGAIALCMPQARIIKPETEALLRQRDAAPKPREHTQNTSIVYGTTVGVTRNRYKPYKFATVITIMVRHSSQESNR